MATLKLFYRNLFENNKNNIDELKRKYNSKSLKNYTMNNPETIFAHICTLGFTACLLYFLIEVDKKEFREQLEIWNY